jgi:5-methylcytosine-specific restriction endonuclease McrA
MQACEALVVRGELKGQPATGSDAGYLRHRRAGETACEPCRVAHNAKMPEYKRRYRDANRQKGRDYAKAYYWRNRDREHERMRRWRAANLDKHAQYSRNWRAANPDKERELGRRREARKRQALSIPFNVGQLAARMAYWGNRCWMCGGEAGTVDHVIPLAAGGPHCLSNLRPACRSCNSSKGNRWWPLNELVA